MDLGLGSGGRGVRLGPQAVGPMILLDTNAVLWLLASHVRSRPLKRWAGRLYLSPVSLLEIQLLMEAGRLRLRGATLADLAADGRWLLDSPPSDALFERAWDYSWTRDPFDRLLVAHAHLRDWRLATADEAITTHLPERRILEL